MEILHIVIITSIIILQIFFFVKSFKEINFIYELICDLSLLNTKNLAVNSDDLNQLSNIELINRLENNKFEEYQNIEEEYRFFFHKISILQHNEASDFLQNLLKTINLYILKNRGVIADTKVIQEIVERSTEAEEELVNNNITIPLYLGLMGTIVGIVIGLLTFSEVGGEIQIMPFLKSVAFAMGASGLGLVFTTINNVNMSSARTHLLKSKNEFYNFIQLNILSAYRDDFQSNVASLKDVVNEFNSKFDKSISNINVLFDKLSATVESQNDIAERLKSTDLNEFFQYNAKMLGKFDTAMSRVEEFSRYFMGINAMLKETRTTTSSINEILINVEDFKKVIIKLDSRIDDALKFDEVLQRYLEFIENNTSLFKSSVDKFGEHAFQSMESLNKGLASQQQEFISKVSERHKKLLDTIDKDALHLDKLLLLEDVKDLLEKNLQVQSQIPLKLNELDKKNQELKTILHTVSDENKSNGKSIRTIENKVGAVQNSVKSANDRIIKVEDTLQKIKSPSLKSLFFGSKVNDDNGKEK